MERIKIVTDSTADLPDYLVDKYQLEVLPLTVHFGEDSYRDGIDIKLHKLLARIREDNEFPTTSQVNPQRFKDSFETFLQQGYKILCITISSKMSGTYQSACIARDMLNSEDIVVIDSKNVTSGLGLIVMHACRLREEKHSLSEIEESVLKLLPHVKSVLAFNSLENLVKGGRLSKTAGVIGGVLGIKPILSVEDGEIVVIDKVRGAKKAQQYVLNYIDKCSLDQKELCILLHVENHDIVDLLRVELLKKGVEFIQCEVGCVVGAHSGPDACGLFYIEKY